MAELTPGTVITLESKETFMEKFFRWMTLFNGVTNVIIIAMLSFIIYGGHTIYVYNKTVVETQILPVVHKVDSTYTVDIMPMIPKVKSWVGEADSVIQDVKSIRHTVDLVKYQIQHGVNLPPDVLASLNHSEKAADSLMSLATDLKLKIASGGAVPDTVKQQIADLHAQSTHLVAKADSTFAKVDKVYTKIEKIDSTFTDATKGKSTWQAIGSFLSGLIGL